MPFLSDEPVFCSKPWTSFEVEHDGAVTPCCMAKFACGNVGQQSIEEIWNGEKYQELRRCMADGERDRICRSECPRLYGTIDDSVSEPTGEVFTLNYRTNLEEIERRARVLVSRPRIWKATGSTACNLDCIMCYQDRKDTRGLPESFFEDLKSFYTCMQEVQVIGGEPFAIRSMRQLMGDFPQERFPDAKFAIVSNGTIHDRRTLQIVRRLQVSWMSLSVDAACESTYARIRRRGDFATTMRGVKKWVALGRERGFPVHLAFTVMRDNVGEMASFAELAQQLGVDILFGRVFGTKADQHLIDERVLRSSVERTREVLAPLRSAMPLANLTLRSIR